MIEKYINNANLFWVMGHAVKCVHCCLWFLIYDASVQWRTFFPYFAPKIIFSHRHHSVSHNTHKKVLLQSSPSARTHAHQQLLFFTLIILISYFYFAGCHDGCIQVYARVVSQEAERCASFFVESEMLAVSPAD